MYDFFWFVCSLLPAFVLSNVFTSVKGRRPRRNKFDLSHERKLSCNMGDLIPVGLQEVVPGDSFRWDTEVFMRLAPLLAPIMHRIDVSVHHFFVPNRLVWNEWEDFITGGEDGLQAPVFPTVNLSDDTGVGRFDVGSLADYLGIPTNADYSTATNDVAISVLPFRAYQLIFNEYYRDQNLTPKIDISLGSGNQAADFNDLTGLRRRCWRKDYFTSALPWSQRGDEVEIPSIIDYRNPADVVDQADGARGTLTIQGSGTGTMDGSLLASSPLAGNTSGTIENIDSLGITVSAFRRAVKIQEWLELAARGGSRYIEQMEMFFGVKSSDARLQRPEFLGGGVMKVSISEVLSTFDDQTGSNPQGTMTGHGVSAGSTAGFKRFFEEHGHVMSILSVTPKTAYQQGINRLWSRTDKFDFYWEQFAHIGEQEVLDKEVYYDPAQSAGQAAGTFGYAPRYSEYKYNPDTVHGDFRSSLAYWHMGRIFSAPPVLNTSFVECDPTFRVFANETATDHHLWVQLYNRISALRPMPYFGTPKL